MKYLVILVSWAFAVAVGGIAAAVVYNYFGTLGAVVWLGGAIAAVQWTAGRHYQDHRR